MESSDLKAFLGVDTSNYTTSVALVFCNNEGEILSYKSERIVLSVEDGMRGMRQSEAHFNHTKNLPILAKRLFSDTDNIQIAAVGCSDRPRNVEGSYMPCFIAGVSAASLTANCLNVPLYYFSHQCMHVASVLYTCNRMDLFEKPHLAYHVSGGTTELLQVMPYESGFKCKIIGKTLDISAGQLIDRVGVMLGLSFPCGAKLEKIANLNIGKVKTCVNGTNINLSGIENKCAEMLNKGKSKEEIASFVIETVKMSLYESAKNALEIYPEQTIVFAGGVSGNTIIREYIKSHLNAEFAQSGLSSDNAVGTAILTARKYFGR